LTALKVSATSHDIKYDFLPIVFSKHQVLSLVAEMR